METFKSIPDSHGVHPMKHAIILTGGAGDRARPLTEDKPKAMISIMGRPLLASLIQWLSAYGIRNITIACGYRYELIQAYFGDGSAHGVNLNYLIEDEPLGSGGALKNALRFLAPSQEPVLVVNVVAPARAHVGTQCSCGVVAVSGVVSFLKGYNISNVPSGGKYSYGMLWFDIEGPGYWSSSPSSNVNFLAA